MTRFEKTGFQTQFLIFRNNKLNPEKLLPQLRSFSGSLWANSSLDSFLINCPSIWALIIEVRGSGDHEEP